MFAWRPCLPPQSPSSGAIPEPPPYSLDESIQRFDEFSKGVCRVVIGDIIEYFKFVDFKKNLKIGMSSIGKMYIVSALLQNALSCLYGINTATSFDLEPPTLQDYFA